MPSTLKPSDCSMVLQLGVFLKETPRSDALLFTLTCWRKFVDEICDETENNFYDSGRQVICDCDCAECHESGRYNLKTRIS